MSSPTYDTFLDPPLQNTVVLLQSSNEFLIDISTQTTFIFINYNISLPLACTGYLSMYYVCYDTVTYGNLSDSIDMECVFDNPI